jgi:glucose/arabinose dehydrogenase
MQPKPDRKKLRRQAYGMGVIALIGFAFGVFIVAAGGLPSQYNLRMGEAVPGIVVPDGFEITVFARDLAAPRSMTSHEDVLFVSERGAGRILAMQDADANLVADEPLVVAENLNAPTGLDYHAGWLYVAEAGQVTRILLDDDLREAEREVIISDTPVGRNDNEVDSNAYALLIHDDELYLSISASCLACQESDSRRATVMVYNLDGSNERVFARGLYRVLGMAANPVNGELWVSNQGRPQLEGDAPETLYAIENGDRAGWPACIAGGMTVPEIDDPDACADVIQPLRTLVPQSNITGIAFYNNEDAPSEYQGNLLAVLHGGVREDGTQDGFVILRMEIDPESGDLLTTEGIPEALVAGFRVSEEPGDYLGRPYDIEMMADGTLFVSDDAASAIYQLRTLN